MGAGSVNQISMKHIRSIVMITVITVVAGIFVWGIIWMKGVPIQYKTVKLSEMDDVTIKKRNNKIKSNNKKFDHVRRSNDGYSVVVEQALPPQKQLRKAQYKREAPANKMRTDAAGTVPGKNMVISHEEETYEAVEYVNDEYVKENENGRKLKPYINKKKTIKKKGKTIYIDLKSRKMSTSKNTPTQRSIRNFNAGENITRHPTSTMSY